VELVQEVASITVMLDNYLRYFHQTGTHHKLQDHPQTQQQSSVMILI